MKKHKLLILLCLCGVYSFAGLANGRVNANLKANKTEAGAFGDVANKGWESSIAHLGDDEYGNARIMEVYQGYQDGESGTLYKSGIMYKGTNQFRWDYKGCLGVGSEANVTYLGKDSNGNAKVLVVKLDEGPAGKPNNLTYFPGTVLKDSNIVIWGKMIFIENCSNFESGITYLGDDANGNARILEIYRIRTYDGIRYFHELHYSVYIFDKNSNEMKWKFGEKMGEVEGLNPAVTYLGDDVNGNAKVLEIHEFNDGIFFTSGIVDKNTYTVTWDFGGTGQVAAEGDNPAITYLGNDANGNAKVIEEHEYAGGIFFTPGIVDKNTNLPTWDFSHTGQVVREGQEPSICYWGNDEKGNAKVIETHSYGGGVFSIIGIVDKYTNIPTWGQTENTLAKAI